MSEKHLRLAAIPVPVATLESLLQSVIALKSSLEVLIGSIGPHEQRAVTFVDLINMGIILHDQIPQKYADPPRRTDA